MVFKKIIFQNRYVALETPSRPLPPSFHGKYHLKFPFWLSAPFPKRKFASPKQNHSGELIDNGNDQKSFNEVPSTSHFYDRAPFELLPNQVEGRTSEICERSSETRFSYFSKVCRDKQTPTLDSRKKSNSLEMWRHETLNSSDSKRKILFYSRHISVTE